MSTVSRWADRRSPWYLFVVAETGSHRRRLGQIGISAIHVVGWSMGGPCAAACATLLADRVRTLTLITPAPLGLDQAGGAEQIGKAFAWLLAGDDPWALSQMPTTLGWEARRNPQLAIDLFTSRSTRPDDGRQRCPASTCATWPARATSSASRARRRSCNQCSTPLNSPRTTVSKLTQEAPQRYRSNAAGAGVSPKERLLVTDVLYRCSARLMPTLISASRLPPHLNHFFPG